MTKKISAAMLQAMANLAAGRSAWHGISGKSAHGGMSGTISALHRRGWLTSRGELSASGRDALQKATGGQAK